MVAFFPIVLSVSFSVLSSLVSGLELHRDGSVGREKGQNRRVPLWKVP